MAADTKNILQALFAAEVETPQGPPPYRHAPGLSVLVLATRIRCNFPSERGQLDFQRE